MRSFLPPFLLVSWIVYAEGYFNRLGTGPGFVCGNTPCHTDIRCDGCDYPRPFANEVSLARAVLSRAEEYIQSVCRVAINVQTGQVAQIQLPVGFMEMSSRNGLTLANDIRSAIEILSYNINHHVVGRITGDIVADLSEGLSIVAKLLTWCRSSASGVPQMPVPQVAINRYQQPMNWNVQCTGGWPCTTLAPFRSAHEAQSASNNWYGYQTQHNRGNTQILNSHYDQGNTVSFGNAGNSAQNSNYLQGELPAPTHLSPAYPVRPRYFGARSQKKPDKKGKKKSEKKKISTSTPKVPVKLDHGHA